MKKKSAEQENPRYIYRTSDEEGDPATYTEKEVFDYLYDMNPEDRPLLFAYKYVGPAELSITITTRENS